mmetsp:Transcript_53943/g.107219  ORF Transcript_53943/g.107219 Transcript_53943/m.107219 type:complete len:137 (-) Transcript_53943:104-514(-)
MARSLALPKRTRAASAPLPSMCSAPLTVTSNPTLAASTSSTRQGFFLSSWGSPAFLHAGSTSSYSRRMQRRSASSKDTDSHPFWRTSQTWPSQTNAVPSLPDLSPRAIAIRSSVEGLDKVVQDVLTWQKKYRTSGT